MLNYTNGSVIIRLHLFFIFNQTILMKQIAFMLAVLFCSTFSVFAQTKIKGKLTDSKDGSPVAGATIRVKGERTSVTSAADGTFEIVTKSGNVLEVTEIGHASQAVKYSGAGYLQISMVQDTKALSEVVITGIGTATSKRKVAISVQSINSDKLPQTPSGSIDQALVGKIAGAQISSSSGNPGSPVSIQFRGPNTIQGGSQPMILVDGVEMASSTLNTLDLNMVDKIEVVQGAASATIYGAQGANGVINIFTKKGKQGTAKIDISSRVSFDQYINLGNLHQPLNHSFNTNTSGDIVQQDPVTGNFVPLSRDSTGVWGDPVWSKAPGILNNTPYKDNTKYYDHIKQLFRSAKTTNNSILITGGKEKSDYAISLSSVNQESIIDGSLKRTNFTTNTGFEVFKNFKVRAITQVVYTQSTLGNNEISAALYTYPFADFTFKDPSGNSPYKFGGGAGANSSNPYYYKQYQHFNDRTWDILPSINANYKFPRFLDFDYKYSLNLSNDDYQRTTDNQTLNLSSLANSSWFVGEDITGGIYNPITRYLSQNSIATANVKFDLPNDFKLAIPLVSTTTFAYDWRKKTTDQTVTEYTGIPLFAANANQANVKSINSVYQDEFITYGYFLNERLDWADWAGVSGGFRSDYASTFGQGQKPHAFYRGDAYVLPSGMGFWDNISSWWPLAKIRAAYGEAGIQPGVFDRIPVLNPQSVDNGTLLYNQSQAANPALNVEVSKEKELGFDFGFKPSKGLWFSSLNLSGTYWNKNSKNVIWIIPVAISTGVSTIKNNAIDWSSKGYEFSLDMSIFKSKNISWNLYSTFGHYTAVVDAVHGATDIPLVWSSAATYTLKPGQAIGTIFGYKAITSVAETDPSGNPYIAKEDQGKYEIVNGRVVNSTSQQVQFTTDKRYLGNTTPKFNMSFTNTINFKDYLSVNFQFDWYYKQYTYNQTKEWMYSEGLHGDFDKPVTINGKTGAFTSYYTSFYDGVESNGTKDYFLENSSFLRLRNLSVSFDVAKFVKIPFVNRLQLVASGRNIWTSTKYTGMDPEASQNTSGGSTNTGTTQTTVQKGLDYWSFPNTKSFQIGLNIGLN